MAGRFERVDLAPLAGKYHAPEGYCRDFAICIADNFISRAIGLMGRAKFGSSDALHIAPCSAIHTFFMRMTIDLIFLDSSKRAISIHSSVRPWTFRYCWGAASVLEMPEGRVKELGISLGGSFSW